MKTGLISFGQHFQRAEVLYNLEKEEEYEYKDGSTDDSYEYDDEYDDEHYYSYYTK